MKKLYSTSMHIVAALGPAGQTFLGAGLLLLPILCMNLASGVWAKVSVTMFYLVAVYFVACIAGSAHEVLRQITNVIERVSIGDLTASNSKTFATKKAAGGTWASIVKMGEALTDIVRQVRASCEIILKTAHEIGGGYKDLYKRTEEQSTMLAVTASGMKELSGTVMQNAENCRRASELAGDASSIALKAAKSMHNVTQTMQRLEANSIKVADIINVIEGIAFQTNILALNAAVEAARAGHNGRGFAVVASEVQTLARSSAGAAKEIKALIEATVTGVTDGVVQVQDAAATIEKAVNSVHSVSGLIGKIASASTVQDVGMEKVNKAIPRLDYVSQQNMALVEQTAASIGVLAEQGQSMFRAVNMFKIDRIEARAAAVDLTQKAIAHLQAVGPNKAFDDFDDKNGRFISGDYYVVAFNNDGARCAVGLTPTKRGDNVRHTSQNWWNGLQKILDKYNRGWFDYEFLNPVSGKQEWKSSYFERSGEFIIGCGIYREPAEIEILMHNPQDYQQVFTAADLSAHRQQH